MFEAKCGYCNLVFSMSEEQQKNVEEEAKAGTETFIIRCPKCHSMVFVHPLVLCGTSDAVPKEVEDRRILCCPVSACIGYVEDDEDKQFSCSECGTVWKNMKEVYRDIELIVKRFAYRKEAYIKKGAKWQSAPFNKIPDHYYANVQNEEV